MAQPAGQAPAETAQGLVSRLGDWAARNPELSRIVLAAVAAVWLGSVLYAWVDGTRRGSRRGLGAVLTLVLPLVGLVLWTLVRPAADARWRRKK
jgi:hypothetical protein